MLQFTKRTEYGLIALVHLTDRAESQRPFVSVREICERVPVPRRLLAEVLKDLHRDGLVDSLRGAQGGYSLARPAQNISVGEVVTCLEGPPVLAECQIPSLLSESSCDVEAFCPIRSPIQRIRTGLLGFLERTTLLDLAQSPGRPRAVETSKEAG